jgi:phosphatidate cytidylyltransferase
MGSEASTAGVGWLIYGAIIGFTGMMGDLAESLLKRDAGVKDSSRWMPGFGGVLDVLDSILFAAPVAFLLWAAGVVKP